MDTTDDAASQAAPPGIACGRQEGGDNGLEARLTRAAWAGDAEAIRREVAALAALFEGSEPGASGVLERAALELAKAHLLDDVRRALPKELDERMQELVRAHCSGTVKAAYKYASYELPPIPPAEAQELLEPLPGAPALAPPPPRRVVPETRDDA
jgi:hypothetical protein